MIDNIETVYETYRAVEVRKPVRCPTCGALPQELAISPGRAVLHDLDCAYEAWRFWKETQQRMFTTEAA
ncbi:MAG: hypothetical protein WCG47_03260 [Dermatophilaceae bacterium]